jgi:hypothetical protein
LRKSTEGNAPFGATWWVCVGTDSVEAPAGLDPARERKDLAVSLEQAFDDSAETWWTLGRKLADDPSAGLAHATACAANSSDLGLMLAWSRLVQRWAAEEDTTLVICPDPWLFRHLSQFPGVVTGPSPGLRVRALRLMLRGFAARSAVAIRVFVAALNLRRQRRRSKIGSPAILVYGHPASDVEGQDGYFGDLLTWCPDLGRVLHVDCPPSRASALGADGRTISLHAFGNPLFALLLPFVRWRPSSRQRTAAVGWLVRRAAAKEGGTGQAAMIRWQQHCQSRWLTECHPSAVAWPWENHSWERHFVRCAHDQGIRTLGYQHSVIGRQMLNYAPASNKAGLEELPSQILCSGPATRDQLIRWGVNQDRLKIAGALRFSAHEPIGCDPGAQVFMALPFDGATAAEMVSAAQVASSRGHRFLVKDHPMTPFVFNPTPEVQYTNRPLGEHPKLASVVYAATTVGLEAILSGLPTLRFCPKGRIALDILPLGVQVPSVDRGTLADALTSPAAPLPIKREDIFAPVDTGLWREAFQTG